MPAAYHPKYSFTIPSHHPQGRDGDALLYSSYAEAICEMLANTTVENKGLTIGIFGDWGMGKSSVLQIVRGLLTENGNELSERAVPHKIYRPLVVPFNAWRYSRQEDLWLAFLRAIFAEVETSLGVDGLAELNLELLWKRIDRSPVYWSGLVRMVLKSLLIGLTVWFTVAIVNFLIVKATEQQLSIANAFLVGGGVTLMASIFAYIWKAIDTILGGKIDLGVPAMIQSGFEQGQIIQQDIFYTDLSTVIEEIAKNRPLVVLIDDLDRCTPEQIISVLEAIKHFDISLSPSTISQNQNGFSPIAFVLAADRRAIERAVRGHFKDYLAEMEEVEREAFAREYIEKIVQVPFELPPLSSKRLGDFLDARSGFKSP